MTAYPDASFLYGLYLPQSSATAAIAYYQAMAEPLNLSELLLCEFRQSLRLQAFLWSRDRTRGISKPAVGKALTGLDSDLSDEIVVIVPCNLIDVLAVAEELSARHTIAKGHRAFDILHVATALHLGAREFLSFHANQRRLAQAEGLQVEPAV